MGTKQRFEQMVKELSSNKKVKVTKTIYGKPAAKADLAAARKLAGGELPPGMEPFYAEMNGFALEWELVDPKLAAGDQSDTGSIKLLPIHGDGGGLFPDEGFGQGVFGDWKETLWFDFQEDDHPYRRLRPLDWFVAEAMAAIYPVPGKARVHYHYCGESLEDIDVGFERYIDLALRSRGFWYWQTALVAGAEENPEVERFHEVMPKLFRDHDAKLFEPSKKAHEVETG